MKKVIVVGAGIAGLSAGIYARRSGFDVTILEQHSTFGGLSTGWSRKGYFIEGGMHWLTGSSPSVPMNKIWKETGALKPQTNIENREVLYTFYDGKEELRLFRYLPDMKKEFLRYAPEDSRMIKKLCREVKAFTKFFMPVMNVFCCKCKNPAPSHLQDLIKMLGAIIKVPRLSRMSIEAYVQRFKNENLRHLLKSVIGYRYNVLSLVYTLGVFASGDCGYPEGGSVTLGKNMAETFVSLGGNIQYKTVVDKIVTESGAVTGVKTTDGVIQADAVIITQDARNAMENLFDKEVKIPWARRMKENVISEQNVFISLGVKKSFSSLPFSLVLPMNPPLEFCGNKWTELRINNYSHYGINAPEGCTTLTCLLIGNSYDFWKKARADGTYRQKKQELAKLFVERVSEFLTEIKDNIEMTDVATPCTYERYCGSFEGSWMSVWKAGGKQHNYPQKLKTVRGVYFAGQRMRMPGGLPIAAYTGRQAVQYLCRDTKTLFI